MPGVMGTSFAKRLAIQVGLGLALSLLSLGGLGCGKKSTDRSAPAQDTKAALVADFPAIDPNAWVNGAPVTLSTLRGKNVVLVEAWHRL